MLIDDYESVDEVFAKTATMSETTYSCSDGQKLLAGKFCLHFGFKF